MSATAAVSKPSSRRSVFQRAFGLIPHWLLRSFLWTLRHTVYQVKVMGSSYVPSQGGALLVPNHMSFVDVLLLLSACPRAVRFLMFQEIYDMPLIRPFARMVKAIPISSGLRPRDHILALRTANEAIRNGDLDSWSRDWLARYRSASPLAV